MKKTQIHAGTVEEPHRTCVAVGQDGFRAVLGGDGAQTAGDGVESFVPRNALEFSLALSTNSLLRVQQTVRGVLALQVAAPGR
jgi:hypothetical protein